MIYLLYGSDTRRSREKLSEIIAEYRRKNGPDLSFYAFDAEDDAPEKIKNALEGGSLFSQKKIIVLKYLAASANRQELLAALEKISGSADAIVFLWERELSLQELGEIKPYCKKVQEFKKQEARSHAQDVNIFRLGDTFFTSAREGLRALLDLLHKGHDDFNLFSYLANHVRTLLTVKHYSGSGQEVPSGHGIHPYIIKKSAALVRDLSMEKLQRDLRCFFTEDHKMKIGVSRPKDSLLALLGDKLGQPRF